MLLATKDAVENSIQRAWEATTKAEAQVRRTAELDADKQAKIIDRLTVAERAFSRALEELWG